MAGTKNCQHTCKPHKHDQSTIQQCKDNCHTKWHPKPPFLVERGVCQGDPLSCLLFNLAIELMSKLLCKTTQIQGLKIETPNSKLAVKLSMFADNAAVFLSDKDNTRSLFKLLDRWCLASGAKFNKDKTVIIPAGSAEYRQQVLETCSLSTDPTTPIPDEIRIQRDGETTRYLGAKVGNNINGTAPWPQIIEKIEKSLNTWKKAYPGSESRNQLIKLRKNPKNDATTRHLPTIHI